MGRDGLFFIVLGRMEVSGVFFFNSSNVNTIRRKAFSFLTVNTKWKNQTENKIPYMQLN